jgi:choline dehydrogenase-like flavoprotein
MIMPQEHFVLWTLCTFRLVIASCSIIGMLANDQTVVDAYGSVNRSYARTSHWDGIKRENYELITWSKVTKIEIEDKKATGVWFRPNVEDENVESTLIKAEKEVIVSAGTFHSPQILQLSGVGPRNLLESAGIETKVDLPGVGQNFHDHTTLTMEIKCKSLQSPSNCGNSADSSLQIRNLISILTSETTTTTIQTSLLGRTSYGKRIVPVPGLSVSGMRELGCQ